MPGGWQRHRWRAAIAIGGGGSSEKPLGESMQHQSAAMARL